MDEKILCVKILWLIQIALDATYWKAFNLKRKYHQKYFAESSQALWKSNKELIIENLDLHEEVRHFLWETSNDKTLATEYYSIKDTKSLSEVKYNKSKYQEGSLETTSTIGK